VVTLAASPTGIVNLPTSINVGTGAKTVSFNFTTKAQSVAKTVRITATLAPTSAFADLVVRAPGIGSLKFTPARVVGPGSSVGRITLDGPAPQGGINLTVTSGNTSYARVAGSNVVHIPAGQLSGTFNVTTSRVSRSVGVLFTATSVLGTKSGYLYVDP
ncbi:MAG: hypothetical protein JNM34_11725, partial [Chthonomonadaceae bacterium]|nr:hypothetical protein [Chthonomonadaceae bacterium]